MPAAAAPSGGKARSLAGGADRLGVVLAAWKRPSPAVPSARSAAKTLRAARRASVSSALRSVSRRPVAAWVQGELLRGALTRACRLQGGRIVIAWLHPKCFLMNTQVSIADSNRGKCKFSKKKIEKGDLRFGWRIGEETWVNCLVDHVHDTVVPAALGASSHDSESAAPAFCLICRLHSVSASCSGLSCLTDVPLLSSPTVPPPVTNSFGWAFGNASAQRRVTTLKRPTSRACLASRLQTEHGKASRERKSVGAFLALCVLSYCAPASLFFFLRVS